ncbi:hypothetical protein OSH11_08500 [Kaistia dalseonensis]|uniref:Uncharacterized protein n=1 Tax=Kaistia dalseonensis TaxID=410840 RepID=A0ABU0H6B4_9HYPH|nr:hypothetical protein [Kaistia dalseonensis]MCX5494739.1 hypothetical protein [Kaistia dalseonensis]MDQ0437320.1 hypothetical protein [Kaistia dalseonensis]
MIPSDHFTRFYNEVFKFLETQGEEALEAYWLAISKNQERHILELIQTRGLDGMYEYWSHIKIEENCDMDIDLDDDRLELRMHLCPSLSKVMDNDAAPMDRYCDHCAGWIGPIMDKTGYHMVYDAIDRQKPQCVMRIFKDKDKARAAETGAELLMGWPGRRAD